MGEQLQMLDSNNRKIITFIITDTTITISVKFLPASLLSATKFTTNNIQNKQNITTTVHKISMGRVKINGCCNVRDN